MNRIDIKNFGPINEASVDLDKKVQVLIGTQASGKSTICKIIYFYQKIKDYTLDFLRIFSYRIWISPCRNSFV